MCPTLILPKVHRVGHAGLRGPRVLVHRAPDREELRLQLRACLVAAALRRCMFGVAQLRLVCAAPQAAKETVGMACACVRLLFPAGLSTVESVVENHCVFLRASTPKIW